MRCNDQVTPWVRSGAFNSYWTYSFINRSAFFSMIPAPYFDFMARFVQNWLWWNDGFVPYFHDRDQGIPSTRIGTALVEKAARKVVGGRVMFKNAGKDSTTEQVNPAVVKISGWADKTDFDKTVRLAVKYAAAAGTSLVKINRGNGGFWTEALRFDSFLPSIGADGSVAAVDCFLRCFTNLGATGVKPADGAALTAYYVVEKRYFGTYVKADGEVLKNTPMCDYVIKRQDGSITQGLFVSRSSAGEVSFRDLPNAMKRSIGRAFPDIAFDAPTLLPFADTLGAELVKWTDCVSALPEVPFGESLLSPIIAQLMSWDYYHAAANTDMYLGRGRVLVPKHIQGVNSGGYNAGMDDFLYTKVESTDPEGVKPTPMQFDLRAEDWRGIRDRLIQDISILTGLNISTIASFIADNTAARTAREISTEENETAEFVNEKRAIVEKPLNRIIKTITRSLGESDTVVIRWSAAGLTNRYALAEILGMALAGGFVSKHKAVQMFNFDDDTQQVQEEYDRIRKEEEKLNIGYGTPIDDMGGDMNEYSEQLDEQASHIN